MRSRAASLALPVVLGCAAPAPAPPTVAVPLAAPPVAASAEPVAPPAPARALCDDRAPCAVRRVRPAGADPQGRKLSVVSLDLGVEKLIEDGEVPKAGNDLTEEEREDTTSPLAFMSACHKLEYWLVVEGRPEARRLLATACNDGYGASGVGEDVLTVGDNAFTHAQHGGSSWRWSWIHKVRLAPLGMLSTAWGGSWAAGSNQDEGIWDWEKFEGRESWFSPACDANGAPPQSGGAETPYESVLVPRAAIDDRFRSDGFRDASLGACALDIDGTGDRGFLTFGPKGDRESASVRAVLSDHDELFVEVRDAHPSGASARWVADDHLEIWLSPAHGGFMDHCLPKRDPPQQWGVRVADGRVFAGYGKPSPTAISVERAAAGPGVVRFKIKLPPKQAGITVAYSDGDGKKQRRVFATSPVRRDAVETLGWTFEVPAGRATCRVKDGKLEPVVTWTVDPDKPFADDR